MPPVIKMSGDTRIGIGAVGIVTDADALNNRIDLHRIDVPNPIAQGMVDIVS